VPRQDYSARDVLLQCGRSLQPMRHAYTAFGVVCAALLFGLALTGCQEGPAEKAGRKIDRAVEKTGDAVRDATTPKK